MGTLHRTEIVTYIQNCSSPVAQKVKNLPAVCLGLITGLGGSPGEGNDYPLKYSINQSVTISLLMDINIIGTE